MRSALRVILGGRQGKGRMQLGTQRPLMRTLADSIRRAAFERIVGPDAMTVVELTRGAA